MGLDRIPKTVKHLSIVFFIAWAGRSMVWNFLPIYFENHIPSVFLVGILTSLPAIITIIIDIPVGNLVQRAGEKVVIFAGFIITVFPGALYLAAMPALMALGKILEGLGKSMIWVGGWSLSLTSSDEEVESESLSVFLVGSRTAKIIFPILGGYLIFTYGFQVPLFLWVVLAALSTAAFYIYLGTAAEEKLSDSIRELLKRKTYMDEVEHIKGNWSSLKLPLGLVLLYSIISSFFWLAVPLLLDEVGAGFITMGAIFGLAALPSIFQYVFGGLADREGDIKIITLLSLSAAIVLAVMSTL